MPEFHRRPPSPFVAVLAVLLGWLVPGLGHLVLGRVIKAGVFFATIAGTFYVGLLLSDFAAIDPRGHPLEFVAQALIGAPTALVLHLTEGRMLHAPPRWMEVGRLYVTVAGILNVVALADVMGEIITRITRRLPPPPPPVALPEVDAGPQWEPHPLVTRSPAAREEDAR